MVFDRLRFRAWRMPVLRAIASRNQLRRWRNAGCPLPPPPQYKYRVISEYAARFGTRTLIETGTYLGDAVRACLGVFDRIYSIELDRCLHERAARRFRRCRNVRILHGDSGEVLPAVLEEVRDRALFWLDGHYSGGITAKGTRETPVMAELAAILAHDVRGHVVLIDDARCFNGSHDYPTIAEIESLLAVQPYARTLDRECDIIRIVDEAWEPS